MMDPKKLPELPAGYEYVQVLGTGGQGEVWLVLNKNMGNPGRYEATKILNPMSFKEYQRFSTEISTLSSLNHPNIITIYYANPEKNYFIMEYVPGTLLENLLKKQQLPMLRGVQIFQQIALGLAAAHIKGLVHRDLKPSNIIVSKEGIAKIMDFGLAKQTTSEDGVTAVKISLGTPEYMAPEQWEDTKTVDHRSDIWSFGVILYRWIAKRLPYIEPSSAKMMYACLTKPIIPPSVVCQDMNAIGKLLEPICLRCLAKEKEARYFNAQEIADEFASILHEYTTQQNVHTRRIIKQNSIAPVEKGKPKAPNAQSIGKQTEAVSELNVVIQNDLLQEAVKKSTETVKIRPTTHDAKSAQAVTFLDDVIPPPIAATPKKKPLKTEKKNPLQPMVILATIALAVVIAAYLFHMPPSMQRLKIMMESGTPVQKMEALKYLEQALLDPQVIEILIIGLNGDYAVRQQSSHLLQKIGSPSVPSLINTLENAFNEYTIDARIEAITLLHGIGDATPEVEKSLYDTIIKTQTPTALRQAAIHTLVYLYPRHQQDFHKVNDVWYRTSELEEMEYVEWNKQWQPIKQLLKPAESKWQEAEEIRLKCESASKDLLQELAFSEANHEIHVTHLINLLELSMETYKQAVQHLAQWAHLQTHFRFKKRLEQQEKAICESIVSFSRQITTLCAQLRSQKHAKSGNRVAAKLNLCLDQAIAWPWCSSSCVEILQKEKAKQK